MRRGEPGGEVMHTSGEFVEHRPMSEKLTQFQPEQSNEEALETLDHEESSVQHTSYDSDAAREQQIYDLVSDVPDEDAPELLTEMVNEGYLDEHPQPGSVGHEVHRLLSTPAEYPDISGANGSAAELSAPSQEAQDQDHSPISAFDEAVRKADALLEAVQEASPPPLTSRGSMSAERALQTLQPPVTQHEVPVTNGETAMPVDTAPAPSLKDMESSGGETVDQTAEEQRKLDIEGENIKAGLRAEAEANRVDPEVAAQDKAVQIKDALDDIAAAGESGGSNIETATPGTGAKTDSEQSASSHSPEGAQTPAPVSGDTARGTATDSAETVKEHQDKRKNVLDLSEHRPDTFADRQQRLREHSEKLRRERLERAEAAAAQKQAEAQEQADREALAKVETDRIDALNATRSPNTYTVQALAEAQNMHMTQDRIDDLAKTKAEASLAYAATETLQQKIDRNRALGQTRAEARNSAQLEMQHASIASTVAEARRGIFEEAEQAGKVTLEAEAVAAAEAKKNQELAEEQAKAIETAREAKLVKSVDEARAMADAENSLQAQAGTERMVNEMRAARGEAPILQPETTVAKAVAESEKARKAYQEGYLDQIQAAVVPGQRADLHGASLQYTEDLRSDLGVDKVPFKTVESGDSALSYFTAHLPGSEGQPGRRSDIVMVERRDLVSGKLLSAVAFNEPQGVVEKTSRFRNKKSFEPSLQLLQEMDKTSLMLRGTNVPGEVAPMTKAEQDALMADSKYYAKVRPQKRPGDPDKPAVGYTPDGGDYNSTSSWAAAQRGATPAEISSQPKSPLKQSRARKWWQQVRNKPNAK